MITEDYVSFETAKLLKEKGFDWYESPFYSDQDRDEWRQNNSYTAPNEEYDPDLPFDSETLTLVAPHVSIQMAMKWLRELHNIFIAINIIPNIPGAIEDKRCYFFKPYKNRLIHNFPLNYSIEIYSTYEEACEAAIKYCLENLI